MAIANDNIPVVERLTSQCQASVHRTITTVLNNDVIARSVVGILVGKCSLSTLQHDSIVIHIHIAATNEHVMTDINVYGIGARTLHSLGGRIDVQVKITDVVGTIDMIRPERGIDQPDILNRHVLTI